MMWLTISAGWCVAAAQAYHSTLSNHFSIAAISA
jgi:hypothetical protein